MTPPYFCDYLPFEKDLALDLYNFEFPLPKDDLYQVWLKLKNLVSALTYPTPPTLIEAMQNSWNENSETYDYIL